MLFMSLFDTSVRSLRRPSWKDSPAKAQRHLLGLALAISTLSTGAWAQISPGAQFDASGSYVGDASNTQVVCYTDGTCARVLVSCDTYVNGVCMSDANTMPPPPVNDNIVSGYSGYYDNGGINSYYWAPPPPPRRWREEPRPTQFLPPAHAQPLQQNTPVPARPAPVQTQPFNAARPSNAQALPQQGFVPQHQTGAQGGGAGAGTTVQPQQGTHRLPY